MVGQGQNRWKGRKKVPQWLWQLQSFFLYDSSAFFQECGEASEPLVPALPLEAAEEVLKIITRKFITEEHELSRKIVHPVRR